MSKRTNLYTRYGSCVHNPTETQLTAAIREVLAKADEEHPDAWIECGSDNGPLHVLSISFGGTSRYTKYSDADMTDELDTAEHRGLGEDQAFQAWKKLITDEGR